MATKRPTVGEVFPIAANPDTVGAVQVQRPLLILFKKVKRATRTERLANLCRAEMAAMRAIHLLTTHAS